MYSVLLRDNMPNSFIEPTKRTRFEKKPSVCLFRRRNKGCVLGLYSCDCNTFFSDLQYTILLYTLINMKNITYIEAQTTLTFSEERSNTWPISNPKINLFIGLNLLANTWRGVFRTSLILRVNLQNLFLGSTV